MVYFDTFFVVVKTTRDVAVCGTNPESLLMPTIAAMFSQD